jgi:hypothetical protein
MKRRHLTGKKSFLAIAMQSGSLEAIRYALENGATANYFDYWWE